MGGPETKRFYTIVGICEEEIVRLQVLGFVAPLGFLQGGTVEGSFTLTDNGREVLGKEIKRLAEDLYPKNPDTSGEPIISDEEDD